MQNRWSKVALHSVVALFLYACSYTIIYCNVLIFHFGALIFFKHAICNKQILHVKNQISFLSMYEKGELLSNVTFSGRKGFCMLQGRELMASS